jgi:DNA transformation protein
MDCIAASSFSALCSMADLYFKTHPETLPEYMEHHAAVFAPSEKQVLKNYREVPVDILEDNERLLLWAKKAAQQ